MAVLLVGDRVQDENETDDEKIAFLKTMMRQYPDEGEPILKELILRLIQAEECLMALDELAFYLPGFPYQDNPVLHVYAGLLALYLAQPKSDADGSEQRTWDLGLLRDAQTYLERAKAIDPDNMIATAYIEQLLTMSQTRQDRGTPDSDDENMVVDEKGQRRKRIRT